MKRRCWDALMQRIGITDGADMYDHLYRAYSESHRHYHTVAHIDACLELFDEYRSLAEHPDSVELAIWFHDAIYKTRSGRNEERSAEWAREFLVEKDVESVDPDEVEQLILATQHNAPAQGNDEVLLVDIDLSILGTSGEIYRQFEDDVRKEYRSVPRFLYRRERVKILQSFLNRDAIYGTADLR